MNIVVIERGGGYGKMDASINVYKNHKDALLKRNEIFTSVCSTIPDYPMGAGRYNDNLPDATVLNGLYLLRPKIQKIGGENWRVLELLNEEGEQEVQVLRMTGYDISLGINLHYRTAETAPEGFAWSTGCITMLETEFRRLREVLGVPAVLKEDEPIIAELFIIGESVKGVYNGRL